MTRALILAGAIASLTASLTMAPAHAATPCATFEVEGNRLDFAVNPFRPNFDNREFSIRVTRASDTISAVRFIIVDTQTNGIFPKIGRGGPDDYSIDALGQDNRPVFMVQNGLLSDTNGAVARFSGAGNTTQVRFQLRVSPGQTVEAQTETEALDVRYECYSGDTVIGGGPVQRDSRVAFNLFAKPHFEAGFGDGTSKSAAVNFGTLGITTGSVDRSVDLNVKSTMPYSVNITSENGSSLSGGKDGDKIPYDISLEGRIVGTGLTCGFNSTAQLTGQTHTLAFAVKGSDARTVRSGTYKDVVTVVVAARDSAVQACRSAG